MNLKRFFRSITQRESIEDILDVASRDYVAKITARPCRTIGFIDVPDHWATENVARNLMTAFDLDHLTLRNVHLFVVTVGKDSTIIIPSQGSFTLAQSVQAYTLRVRTRAFGLVTRRKGAGLTLAPKRNLTQSDSL